MNPNNNDSNNNNSVPAGSVSEPTNSSAPSWGSTPAAPASNSQPAPGWGPTPTSVPPNLEPTQPALDNPLPRTPQPADNPFGNPGVTGEITPAVTAETPEPVPTDLSHLTDNSPLSNNSSISASTVDSLVVASPTVDTDAISTEAAQKGFPKILFILGGVVLLAVIGASAYFILGIGQTKPTPAVQPENSPPKSLIPTMVPLPTVAIPTPASATQPGTLGGSLDNPAESTKTSRRAIDLLKER